MTSIYHLIITVNHSILQNDFCIHLVNSFVTQMNGDSKEMFSIGATRTEPCLYPLMNGEILVLKDEMQVSLDTNAKPTQPQSLTWSEQPISIEHVQPYILALIPR